jgi:hypothetical protein
VLRECDARVVPGEVLAVIRASQERVPCTLGGGAALSGAHLGQRLSRDVDLVCRRTEDVRSLVREFPEIARHTDSEIVLVRDAGTFIRRSGYHPEADLGLASQKDAGMDPGVLAWLLGQFPLAPLPTMLAALTSDELRAFRDSLRERLRVLAIGE